VTGTGKERRGEGEKEERAGEEEREGVCPCPRNKKKKSRRLWSAVSVADLYLENVSFCSWRMLRFSLAMSSVCVPSHSVRS